MTATAAAPLHDPNDTALIRTLGHAGLIPFVLLAALLWLVKVELQAWVAIALAAYAALIASFLGGIHWGLAWARATPGTEPAGIHLLWGVVPSLLAWPGLLMPPHAGLVWLGALLALCYGVDRRLYPAAGLGRWLTLRWRLSAVATLSCLVGAGAL